MKGPAPRLTREQIADVALAIIDAKGLDALTIKAVGDELGVHSTALYRYFPTKQALVEAVLTQAFRSTDAAIPVEGTPSDRLLALARASRRSVEAHPQLAWAYLTMQDEQSTNAFAQEISDALRDMGLKGHDLALAFHLLVSFGLSTSVYDFAGYPDSLEARRRGRRMTGIPELEESSRSTDAMRALSDEAFELGAQALVKAVENLSRPSGPALEAD